MLHSLSGRPRRRLWLRRNSTGQPECPPRQSNRLTGLYPPCTDFRRLPRQQVLNRLSSLSVLLYHLCVLPRILSTSFTSSSLMIPFIILICTILAYSLATCSERANLAIASFVMALRA